MRAASFVAAFLAAVAAFADVPDIERRIREQDALAAKGDDVRLLNEAKAAVVADGSAVNLYLLGRGYGMIRELEKAREQFDLALEKDPAFPYAFHGIGVYYVLKGNLAEAEKSFLSALKLDPNLSRARIELAKLHIVKEDFDSAQRELLEVLERSPDDVDVRAMLGHVHLRRKDYEKAAHEFRAVLSKDARNRGAQKALAVALGLAGKREEAAAEFRRAIVLDPDDPESYMFLKNLLLEQGDAAGAIALLKSFLARLPADGALAKNVGDEIGRLERGEAVGAPSTLGDLLKRLDSPDPAERRQAMSALVSLKLPGLPVRMVRAVQDSDEAVRVMAISELGRTGGPDAVGLLEVLLRHEKERDASERARGAAARALMDVKSPAAVPVLVAALDEESHYVFCLVSGSLTYYTGIYFTDDPSDPIPPERRAEFRAKWNAWWASPRSFSAKVQAIAEISSIRLSRLAGYVAALIGDEDPPVAGRALAAFFTLTGERAGGEADLATPEGRARARAKADEILAARRNAGRK